MNNKDQLRQGVITVFREGPGWGFIQSGGDRYFFHKSTCRNGAKGFDHLRNGLPVEFTVKHVPDKGLQAFDVNRLHCRVEFLEPESFVVTAEKEPRFGSTFGRAHISLINDESPAAAHDALIELAESLGFNGVVNRRYEQRLKIGDDGSREKYWHIEGDLTIVAIPYPESKHTYTRDDINTRLEEAEIGHAHYCYQLNQEKDVNAL